MNRGPNNRSAIGIVGQSIEAQVFHQWAVIKVVKAVSCLLTEIVDAGPAVGITFTPEPCATRDH